jgi:hypothetical protein
MSSGKDASNLSRMTLNRTDILDAAVTMIVVVPMYEVMSRRSCILEACKAAWRELWSILCSAEQRFDERIVIANRRTRVRRLDS